eukprot:TRINITY_DN55660_c0_g1_i1.p1 TRINITY_DN55660_c0_g1~~TRINITY_DN55660_c0_g1_i1.p1  ORF type:complete len:698 (-),score=92.81 TRINITY_DN55660_c0_g1_i1:71-2164(-)
MSLAFEAVPWFKALPNQAVTSFVLHSAVALWRDPVPPRAFDMRRRRFAVNRQDASEISADRRDCRKPTKAPRRSSRGWERQQARNEMRACISAVHLAWRGRQLQTVLDTMSAVKDRGISPNVVSFGIAVNACDRLQRWGEAIDLLCHMRLRVMQPNAVVYTAAISACSKASRWDISLLLFHGALASTPRPLPVNICDGDNQGTMRYAPNIVKAGGAAESNGTIAAGRPLLSDLSVDLVTFNAAITACERGALWGEAVDLLGIMRRFGLSPDVVSYSAAISACERFGSWEGALAVFEGMLHEGLSPDLVTYNATLAACSQGGRWQEAINLLGELRDAGLVPDAVSWAETIGGCTQAAAWREALAVARLMQEHGANLASACALTSGKLPRRRDGPRSSGSSASIAYCAAIGAAGVGQNWQVALGLHSEATRRFQSCIGGSIGSESSAGVCGGGGDYSDGSDSEDSFKAPRADTAALWDVYARVVRVLRSSGRLAEALALFREAGERGLVDVSHRGDDWHLTEHAAIDMHDLPLEVAEVALCAALMDRALHGCPANVVALRAVNRESNASSFAAARRGRLGEGGYEGSGHDRSSCGDGSDGAVGTIQEDLLVVTGMGRRHSALGRSTIFPALLQMLRIELGLLDAYADPCIQGRIRVPDATVRLLLTPTAPHTFAIDAAGICAWTSENLTQKDRLDLEPE